MTWGLLNQMPTDYGKTSISAIIPAYNIEAYVGDAVQSALNQTPPFAEIIVIDDGSTDGTSEVIAGFADPSIRYFYQENRGLGPARNLGVEHATSEYIYFLDGDDIIVPEFTKAISGAIEPSSELPDIVWFSAAAFGGEKEAIDRYDSYYERSVAGKFLCGREALHESLAAKSYPSSACLYVFRRALLDVGQPLRFPAILHEDEVFTPNLLFRCGQTVVLDDRLYRRRLRVGSIMSQKPTSKNVVGYLMAVRIWCQLVEQVEKRQVRRFRLQMYHRYANAVRVAVKAHLAVHEMKRLVRLFCPSFGRSVSFDMKLAKWSLWVAVKIIRLRAEVRVRGGR